MDDSLVKKRLNNLKKTKKLSKFSRKVQKYKYLNVEHTKLKPYTYTVVLKDTNVVTKINGKIAQLGARLVEGSVKKNTTLFFNNFINSLYSSNSKYSL